MAPTRAESVIKLAADVSLERLLDLVIAHPDWLRIDLQQELAGRAEPLARNLAASLAAMRTALLADPRPLQDAESPIAKLWLDIDVEISFPDALKLAASPAIAECLVEPYAAALAGLVGETVIDPARIAEGRDLLELMSAIADVAIGPEAEGVQFQVDTLLVEFARTTLSEIFDPTLFQRAVAIATRFATDAERDRDSERHAEWLTELALVLSEPFVRSAAIHKGSAMRRAAERAAANPHQRTLDTQAIAWAIDFDARLDEALAAVDRALEIGAKAGRPRRAFVKLNILRRAVSYDRPVDRRVFDELVKMSSSLAKDRDLVPRITYLAAIAPREERHLAEAVEEMTAYLAAHPDALTATDASPILLANLVAEAAEALPFRPDTGLAAIGLFRTLLPDLPERSRLHLLQAENVLLGPLLVRRKGVAAALPLLRDPQSPEAVRDALRRSGALDEDRPAEDRAALLLLAAGPIVLPEDPGEPLKMIGQAFALAPDLLWPHHDAIELSIAGAYAGRFSAAVARGDHRLALDCLQISTEYYARLGFVDAVEELLNLIEYWRETGGPGVDPFVALFVVTEYPVIDPILPDSGRRVLRRLADGLLARLQTFHHGLALGIIASLGGNLFASVLASEPGRLDDTAVEIADELRSLHDLREDEPLAAERRKQEIELLLPQRGYLADEGVPTRTRVRQLHQRSVDEQLWRATTAADEAPKASHEAVAAQLGPEDAVVIFHVAREHLTFTIVGTEDLWVVQQPNLPDAMRIQASRAWLTISALESELFLTREAVQDDPGPFDVSSAGRERLRRMGDGFFGELEAQLVALEKRGVKHMCIVASDALLMMPFHLAEVGGGLFLDRFRISYAGQWRLAGRANPSIRAPGVMAFGVTGGGGRLPALANAADEARTIAAACGGTAVTDGNATTMAIRAALASSRFVHLAAHGGQVPYASSLHWLQTGERGGDGRLRALDLLDLDLRGLDLVTLSTCESGTSVFDEFGDQRGIPAVLFARGAQAVVGTSWPVESKVSQRFFEQLYTQIGAGLEPFAAFCAAQELVRAEHRQLRDWGAFFYSGRW